MQCYILCKWECSRRKCIFSLSIAISSVWSNPLASHIKIYTASRGFPATARLLLSVSCYAIAMGQIIKYITKCELNGKRCCNVVLHRSWVISLICRWKCWRPFWCGLTWCSMWPALSVMTTTLCSYWASPDVLRDERSLCCARCAGPGIRLWLAGRSHPLHTGSVTSSRSWLNVSTHTWLGLGPPSATNVVLVLVLVLVLFVLIRFSNP